MKVQLFPVDLPEGMWKVFLVEDDESGDMQGHNFTTLGGLYAALDIAKEHAMRATGAGRVSLWAYQRGLDYYEAKVEV
jgi:hypothetical protein